MKECCGLAKHVQMNGHMQCKSLLFLREILITINEGRCIVSHITQRIQTDVDLLVEGTMCWPRVDNDRALIYHNDQVTSKTPTSDHLQIKKTDKQVHYVINLTFRILTQHKHKNWNSHCL